MRSKSLEGSRQRPCRASDATSQGHRWHHPGCQKHQDLHGTGSLKAAAPTALPAVHVSPSAPSRHRCCSGQWHLKVQQCTCCQAGPTCALPAFSACSVGQTGSNVKKTHAQQMFIFVNIPKCHTCSTKACPGPSGEEEQWLGALRDAAGQAEHPAPWGLLSVHFQKAPGTVKGLHQI